MRLTTGLDRLLVDPSELAGRRFGLLSQQAVVDGQLRPAHLTLTAAGHPPSRLFAPEHGYYGVEQDMVAANQNLDPLTDIPIVSLYGDDQDSLHPVPEAFEGLDLLIVDLQDIGSRYYTYPATAVWATSVARQAGCEVWILDRPNPLGGMKVEGNRRGEGFASFVGAFEHPVCHGLTLAELVLLELGLDPGNAKANAVRVWAMEGWSRAQTWPDLERSWVAPSPNMPSYETAVIYPGLCLLEATELSEGRGTTRPFHLVGSPRVDPLVLAEALTAMPTPGLSFIPTYFRPQFQKHAGAVCGGVEIVVTDAAKVEAYRFGLELLRILRRQLGGEFGWRQAPYEFVSDRPAIDLLTGGSTVRQAIDTGDDTLLASWCAEFSVQEAAFRTHREPCLLYSED